MDRVTSKPAKDRSTVLRTVTRGVGAAACAALLVAAAIGGPACGFGPPLPEGAELIPSDATFAVSVDLRAILDSEVYALLRGDERFFGQNRLNFYKFAEATGIDPSKDIERLLFMARGREEGIPEMTGLVIGAFDGLKVHDYLVETGLDVRRVAGMDIFEMVVLNGQCAFCLAVVDASTAAFGTGDGLEAIARVRAGEAPALATEPRAGRLLRRLGRHPEAWGIIRSGELLSGLEDVFSRLAGESALTALGPIEEVTFSFDTEEPLRVLIELAASNDKDALLVADVLRGAESLGRIALGEARPDMGRLMSDLTIEADTGIVRVGGSLTASEIRSIAEYLQRGWPGAPPGPATPAP